MTRRRGLFFPHKEKESCYRNGGRGKNRRSSLLLSLFSSSTCPLAPLIKLQWYSKEEEEGPRWGRTGRGIKCWCCTQHCMVLECGWYTRMRRTYRLVVWWTVGNSFLDRQRISRGKVHGENLQVLILFLTMREENRTGVARRPTHPNKNSLQLPTFFGV